jgi:hypothetical protein
MVVVEERAHRHHGSVAAGSAVASLGVSTMDIAGILLTGASDRIWPTDWIYG